MMRAPAKCMGTPFGFVYEAMRPLIGTAYGGGGPTLGMIASVLKSRRKKALEDDLLDFKNGLKAQEKLMEERR